MVAPAATETLDGAIVTEGEPLDSETVTPPAGAGVESVTGNGADCPGESVMPPGKLIVPGAGGPELPTVTVKVVSVIEGALA